VTKTATSVAVAIVIYVLYSFLFLCCPRYPHVVYILDVLRYSYFVLLITTLEHIRLQTRGRFQPESANCPVSMQLADLIYTRNLTSNWKSTVR